MSILKLGIPKGSLEKATIELFEKSGWRIKLSKRSYFPEIDDEELACSICRAQEMSRYVEQGVIDAGITGKDWILQKSARDRPAGLLRFQVIPRLKNLKILKGKRSPQNL
jgi:ATP phosphoribosyltransferase